MQWKNNVRGKFPSIFIILVLPLLFFLLFGNQFLYLPGAEFSDLTVSHLPNALFLRRALTEWHQIPLWSPTILSGYPFAANPLSGLFYSPGWLSVIWPTAWTFNLLAGLHLTWGGVGMALFLKKQNLRELPAVFGGLTFAFMPKLLAHYGAGHITLLYAVSWTPWLLSASTLSSTPFLSRPLLSPAVILALIFFADVRWAAFAGILWMAWCFLGGFACSQIGVGGALANGTPGADAPASEIPPLNRVPPSKPSASFRALLRPMFFFFAQLLLTAALVAPLALPLLEYMRLSTRAALGVEDVLAFSLPPARLLGFLFPELGGNQEWVVYPGMFTLTLALMGLFWPAVRRKLAFGWGVLGVALLYALGENLPGMTLLAHSPGISLLRVPPRAMFLAGMALSVLAAFALEHLLAGVRIKERRAGMRVLVLLFGLTAMMAVGVRFLSGTLPPNFAWGAGMAGVALLSLGRLLHNATPRGLGLLIVGLSLFDLCGVGVQSLAPRTPAEIYADQAEVAQFLAAQPGPFRVYSPSYSLPQTTAARFNLDLADGVDPMQLQSYVTFMTNATGVPQTGYSVTMPPFEGEVATSNAAYLPNANLLGLLNVRYLVTAFDLQTKGLSLLQTFGSTRIYENTLAHPHAWMQDGTPLPDTELTWTPNRITLTATGPGQLVLSELAYPGWQVSVDGMRTEILTVDGLLRGVDLPAGTHEVIFAFWPASISWGLSIFILAMLFLFSQKRKSGFFAWRDSIQRGTA